MDFLATCEQDYAKSYNAFRKEFIPGQKGYLRDIVAPQVIENIRVNNLGEGELHILGVGCGYGDLDIVFLEELIKEFQGRLRIIYTVVDISRVFMDGFRKEINGKGDSLQNIEFRFIEQDYNEFVKDERNHTQSYSVINFWHVLYYLEVEDVLQSSMTHILKPGGCIVSILSCEEGFFYRVKIKFEPRVQDCYHNYGNVTSSVLAKLAKQNNWTCNVFYGLKEHDVTGAFHPESEAGRTVLDFFFQRSNFVGSVSQEILLEILEYFKRHVYTHDTDKSGRKFVGSKDGIVFFYKPKQ